MDPAFWAERWREGRIGFHEGHVNPYLEKHAERIAGRRVLVPLCGKSEDLVYLATHGHEVVGVEVVEQAVTAFFAEHARVPTLRPRGQNLAYTSGPVTVICGDLFGVTRDETGPIGAVYDRAALIALPPELRVRYAAHLREHAAGALMLLVSLEYDQALMAGPPHSVPDAEVRALYAGCAIELLDEGPTQSGRMRDAGFPSTERVYLVQL